MHSAYIDEHGDPDALSVGELETPEPGPNEVLVDVRAASVNPHDIALREGAVPVDSFPHIPGLDCAGVVTEVGDNSEFKIGDRIFAINEDDQGPGGYADEAVVSTSAAAKLPDDCDFETGAAAALVGTTAWRGLFQKGQVRPATRALLHSGSGGVGHMAVQLASVAGADVTTTARPEYHETLADLGATTTLDYARDDLGDAIADRGPIEFVLDTQANEYSELDADVADQGATIVAVGTEAPTATVPVAMGLGKGFTYEPMSVYHIPNKSKVLSKLAALLADGEIDPVVAETFDLEEIAAAHRYLTRESFVGKIVVTP